MRNNIILVLLLLSTAIYSQVYKCSKEQNQIKVYEFVLENLDSVKKYNNQEFIMVKIEYNRSYGIEKISYSGNSSPTTFNNDTPAIDIWFPLEYYIQNTFRFCPENFFQSKNTWNSSFKFGIPLSKKDLLTGIKNLKSQQNTREKPHNIPANCKFKLVVDTLLFNKISYPKTEIKSSLDIFSSEIIEIAPNFYFVFRLIETSGKGYGYYETKTSKDFMEYKLFYLNGNSPELVLNGRQRISNRKIYITQSFSASDDRLEDSDFCDPEDNLYQSKDFKLMLEIMFL